METEALDLRKAAANRWIIENVPDRDYYSSWEEGKNFVEWDVLLEFMALYKSQSPQSAAVSEEAQERYDKARVWYNTRLGRTGLDDSDDEAIIANEAMLIAAGLLTTPEEKRSDSSSLDDQDLVKRMPDYKRKIKKGPPPDAKGGSHG